MLHVVLHRGPNQPGRSAQPGRLSLARGVFVDRSDWDALDRLERRRLRVRARLTTLRSGIPGAVSHWSAAALWGLPDLDPEDGRLHLVDPTRSRTHSGPGVVRHAAELPASDRTSIDGVPVTDPLRTVVDVIRASSFDHAVVVLDHALHVDLVTRDAVGAALDLVPGRRGTAMALRALDFADGRAETPGESMSRIVVDDLGLPAPDLQREFVTDRGRFRVDFFWPEVGVVGEFDGRVKYGSGDPDVLWAEKQREDALRRARGVTSVARWTSADVRTPTRLAQILHVAGVPGSGQRNTALPARHRP